MDNDKVSSLLKALDEHVAELRAQQYFSSQMEPREIVRFNQSIAAEKRLIRYEIESGKAVDAVKVKR